jgi:hypothetical protein
VDVYQVGQTLNLTDRANRSNVYVQQWNLNLQRQLPGNWLVEAAYAGNKGTRLPVYWQFNQQDPQFLSLGQSLYETVDNPFFGIVQTGFLAPARVQRLQLLRPYPQYTSIASFMKNVGSSTYHSIQLRAQKRYSRGLTLSLAYTAGKLIDNASGRVIGFTEFLPPVQNYYNLRAERSISEGDISQRLTPSVTYDLPLGRGKRWLGGASGPLRRVVEGWSISSWAAFHTGFPLRLTSAGSPGIFGTVLRPNNSGRSAALEGRIQDRLTRYFDISVFSIPQPFTYGNTSRTLPDARGPGRRNIDLSLRKSTAITEKVAFQLRVEAYNLTNTPMFDPPATALGASTFGVINSARNSRTMQSAGKLTW